ncbi:EamA family transporter [Gordonia mangrovi]|uniref:EamA family transporter n=1 Tax=Gordonia mangrovi TaxID=2665643 RepID=UPI0035A0B7B9
MVNTRTRTSTGLLLGLASSAAFALSGVLARAMIDSGWTAGATVTLRITLGAALLVVPGIIALRGNWNALRRSWSFVLAYGVLAVATCQLAYFYAVTYLQVGVALLIEYTAPVAVIGWMWLRHRQRPGRLTILGAAVALAGLALVLDLRGGVGIDALGVVWALIAMVGAAAYFVISADDRIDLPPLTLAAGGLTIGAVGLSLAGLVGLLPMAATTDAVTLAGRSMAWWVPAALLGVVTAALAYSLGIAAGRRLGSRVMSFVGLSEVLFAVLFAWAALAELPTSGQLLGGGLIVVGVIVVRSGEASTRGEEPVI